MLLGFLLVIQSLGTSRLSHDGDRLPFFVSIQPGRTLLTRISQLPNSLSVPTTLSLSNNLLVVSSASRIFDQPQYIDILFNAGEWEFENTFFVRFEYGEIIQGPFDLGIVGIGPLSPLVASAHSVSVFDDEIVFGESNEYFVNKCENNSVIQVPFVNEATGTFIRGSWSDQEVVEVELGFSSSILTVPEPVLRNITDRIREVGAIHQPNITHMKFSSCLRDSMVESLPSISISLYNTAGPVGVVSIHPEDYIDFDQESSECRLKLARTSDGGFSINPLELAGMNLRITSTDLIICDANDG